MRYIANNQTNKQTQAPILLLMLFTDGQLTNFLVYQPNKYFKLMALLKL